MLTTVAGDTTAFTTSWVMKEIFHNDNKHLDAVNTIRAELEGLGLTNNFLLYDDTPVSTRSVRY